MIKVQVIGQQSETVVPKATKAEEIQEQVSLSTNAVTVLVLKNEKDEVVGKFSPSKIAGWWVA